MEYWDTRYSATSGPPKYSNIPFPGPRRSTTTHRAVLIALVWGIFLCGCTTPQTASHVTADRDGLDIFDSAPTDLQDSELRLAQALAHYLKGLVFDAVDAEDGRPLSARASEEFERAFELDPEYAETPLRLAKRYHAGGRREDAIRVLLKAREYHPDHFAIQLLLAYVYQENNEYKKSLAEYLRLVKRVPARSAGYVGAANAYLVLKEEEKAYAILDKARTESGEPENVIEVCNWLVAEYLRTRQIPNAIRCMEILQAAQPEDPAVFLRLFGFYLADRRNDAAADLVRRAPQTMLKKPQFHLAVAELFLETGFYKEAATAFERTETACRNESVDPGFLDSAFYYRYAAACERSAQFPKAAELLTRSIELDGNNHAAMNYLAYMWAEQDTNLEQGLDHVLRALEFDPQNAAYIDTLGWIYFKQKNYGKAMEQIERASLLMPDDTVVAEHLGDVHNALNDTPNALANWKRSFLLDRENEAVANKLKLHGIDPSKLPGTTDKSQSAPAEGPPE